ncbi:MAG: adenine deaminase C-terminal domain-containing protein [Armatimonadota bacterium]|nr:adenine deaminase C-terminal domain-containing protein [Armatimonadota bacterium]MDR7512144.1 adenine deaminase C-terminal domain-containing protein [Armatimonadota bacterium]
MPISSATAAFHVGCIISHLLVTMGFGVERPAFLPRARMGAVKRTFRTLDEARRLVAVSRGDEPADLLITGASVLNVYSGELLPATVAVAGGRVAYVGARAPAPGLRTTVLDARGRVLVPGYVDPHAHPQAMFTPDEFARAVLPLGTTAVVADTLPLLVLAEPGRDAAAMDALAALPLRFFWFLRLHGQSHSPSEARITDERLTALVAREEVRTVGEVTRWARVYAGDETLLRRMHAGLAAGRRVEGHAPGASGDRVQVLAAAGVSADHEAITAAQALDRLRAGLYVMLRHGSLRPDLPALAPLASAARAFSGRLMLTPDGPSAPFIRDHGYLDHVLGVAMAHGIDPVAAYQMATLNPATYYGLDEEHGGIAPGRRADILLLESLERPRPEAVIAGGVIVARDGRLAVEIPRLPWGEWLRPYAPGGWRPGPEVFALDGLPSPVPAMHMENAVIATRRDVALDAARAGDGLPPGVLRLVLLDPAGEWRCRTLLSGFADDLGGLASSYNAGAGLYVLGRRSADMAAAAARVLEMGGGIALAEGGTVRFAFPLNVGGLMSDRSMAEVAAAVETLTALLRPRGYRHHDIGYSLLFLGFDGLPYVRLTYRGVWDVVAGEALLPREAL